MNPSVIKLLIDLADQKAKTASIALASALKDEQSTKDKSNTLYQFANQYEDKLSQKSLTGISISEYRNTRQFISNIEKIALQQSTYIQFAKDAVSQRQADFRAIELTNNTGFGYYQSGTAVNSFAGNVFRHSVSIITL